MSVVNPLKTSPLPGVLPRVHPESVTAITNAQHTMRAHEVEQQLAMSAVDLDLHSGFPSLDGRLISLFCL